MIKRSASLFVFLVLVTAVAWAANGPTHVPTLDDLITLKSIAGTQISPDGKWIAYPVTYGDFKQDAFITQIWLADNATGKSFQLTRGDKSSTNPRWSPDGKWLAFLSIDWKTETRSLSSIRAEAKPSS
jgi:Tol biopolymer transport system component